MNQTKEKTVQYETGLVALVQRHANEVGEGCSQAEPPRQVFAMVLLLVVGCATGNLDDQ